MALFHDALDLLLDLRLVPLQLLANSLHLRSERERERAGKGQKKKLKLTRVHRSHRSCPTRTRHHPP